MKYLKKSPLTKIKKIKTFIKTSLHKGNDMKFYTLKNFAVISQVQFVTEYRKAAKAFRRARFLRL